MNPRISGNAALAALAEWATEFAQREIGACVSASIIASLMSIAEKIDNGIINPNLHVSVSAAPELPSPGSLASSGDLRCGVYGVSANPPTFRHVAAALLAMDQLLLDVVAWRPHGEIEHKTVAPADRVPIKDRHEMLCRMIQPCGRMFRYSDLGLHNADVSEKSLFEIASRNSQGRFFFLSGSDSPERVQEVARNLSFFASESQFKTVSLDKINWAVVQRNRFGRGLTKSKLDNLIASHLTAPIKTFVIANPGASDFASTDVRQEQMYALIPQAAYEIVLKKGYYAPGEI